MVGQTLNASAISLLGTQNFATSTSAAISAPAGTPSQFSFLEGMATNTALSTAQISRAYNYLTRRYSGTQNIAISPNLYWNAALNSDRIAPVTVNGGHIEGVGAGDGYRYIFHTALIEKYDENWNLVTSNQSIFTGVIPAGGSYHCGGGTYLDGKIFAPLEVALGPDGQWIGVYDATKPGLPLITSVDVSAHQSEFSALTIAPTAGTDGVMFGTSYYAQHGGSQLTMYDYAGGNVTSPQFGAFLGTLPIPATITNIQGVAWKAPYLYFSSSNSLPGGNGGGIERVLYQNGVLSNQAELVWNANTTVQGLGFEGSNLLEALQSGGSDNIVATFASGKFTSVGNGATATWNSNGNGAFSDPSWDPALPNAAGAIAIFGDGTTNAVVGTVQVTVDAPYVVGSLVFNPTAGASYTLAGDNIPTHAITLTSGAGTGSSISVTAGSHTISTNLVLADAGGQTFNIAPASQLTIAGSISEILGSQSVSLTGGGTLVFGSANSYSGGTTVAVGTLQTTADGALGSGGLILSAAAGVTSTVQLGGNETLASLSANIATGGRAVVSEIAGKTLNIGGLSKSGAGTLEIQTAPALAGGQTIAISGGVLRFNIAGATPAGSNITGGTTATVTIADGATLELAGSAAALTQSANVVNNSQAASGGVHVTGTNQQAGTISGAGNVVVEDGAILSVYQILQNSLTINGAGTVALLPSGSGSTMNPEGPNNINYSSDLKLLSIAGAPDAWTGTLDIGNNGLVIAYGSAVDPFATIENQIKSGYANGQWTGTGITSGIARAAVGSGPPLNIGAIDFVPNGPGFGPSIGFEGQTIATSAVLLRLTYMDDLVLAGDMQQANATSDALFFAANYGAGTTWTTGDLTHDGAIDTNDALLFAANYVVGLPSLDGAIGNAAVLGNSVVSAPEPSCFALGALGAMGLRFIPGRRRPSQPEIVLSDDI